MTPAAETRSEPAVTRWPAPAKLNLFLHVTGRRADGYHLLDSLVAVVDIGDRLRAEPATALSLTVDGPEAADLAGLALPKVLSDPLAAAADMVKFAIDAGGADNITVVLIPYLSPETP